MDPWRGRALALAGKRRHSASAHQIPLDHRPHRSQELLRRRRRDPRNLEHIAAQRQPEQLGGDDAYETLRKPIAQQVVTLADRLTRMATAPRALRGLRNVVLSLLARLPNFRRTLAWQLSGLVYR
jgi:hypothetical protein